MVIMHAVYGTLHVKRSSYSCWLRMQCTVHWLLKDYHNHVNYAANVPARCGLLFKAIIFMLVPGGYNHPFYPSIHDIDHV